MTTETLMRRTFLAAIAATTGSLILPAGIRAQSSTYPSKPVRFIVGLGPGSGADTGTRFVAERFGKLVGVSGQSIYNWEHQVTTPRARQLQVIAVVIMPNTSASVSSRKRKNQLHPFQVQVVVQVIKKISTRNQLQGLNQHLKENCQIKTSKSKLRLQWLVCKVRRISKVSVRISVGRSVKVVRKQKRLV
jgi:hypothetical protein